MTRELLVGTTAGLLACSVAILLAGTAIMSRAAPPLGGMAVPQSPPSPTVQRLACANVRPPLPGDVEMLVRQDTSDAARAAAVRVLCNQ